MPRHAARPDALSVIGETSPIRGLALGPPWRAVLATLVAVSGGSALAAALMTWFAPDRLPTGTLLRIAALLVLAPALIAWVVRRWCATTMAVTNDALVLHGSAGGVEVPLRSIAAVVAWRVPLPAAGMCVQLGSGRRLREGLVPDDPAALIAAFRLAGVAEAALAPTAQHPTTAFGTAKHAARRRWLDHPLVKFVLFSLVPTVPLFRLRQRIVYGGIFGEYYQYGLKTYLLGFAVFWLLYAIYLVLYAAVLRGITETGALAAAWTRPATARRVRRAVETLHRIFYYGGIPAVLALRLFPW